MHWSDIRIKEMLTKVDINWKEEMPIIISKRLAIILFRKMTNI